LLPAGDRAEPSAIQATVVRNGTPSA
jgi:hypothetical protein